MATFTLTCIGDDRPGLLTVLSAPITARGASWEHSQMARLGGKFAGILMLQVADEQSEALIADLIELKHDGLLVTVEQTAGTTADSGVQLNLELLGADRPGIVDEIFAALASQNVSVEELSTDVREAPMAGGMLFEARAVLAAPDATSTDGLRSILEQLSDELMVEIKLSEAEGTTALVTE